MPEGEKAEDGYIGQEKATFIAMTMISIIKSEDWDWTCSSYLLLCGQPCPRSGEHWVTFGFQNPDPLKDIRGTGILPLYQLLYFVEEYNDLAHTYYKHSIHEMFDFPFAIQMMEFTTYVLKAL